MTTNKDTHKGEEVEMQPIVSGSIEDIANHITKMVITSYKEENKALWAENIRLQRDLKEIKEDCEDLFYRCKSQVDKGLTKEINVFLTKLGGG